MIPLLTFLACARTDVPLTDSEPLPSCQSPGALDDTLQLHQVQALATHNSTHLEPDTVLDDSHRYSHAPLATQLGEFGVRGFELDLHLRDGLGLQVFHLPVIDEETTCLQFSDCLAEAWAWSQENPCHLPLVFWLEPKDDMDALVPDLLPLSGAWELVDDTILQAWPRSRLLTPDDVRGEFDTLTEAIQSWDSPLSASCAAEPSSPSSMTEPIGTSTSWITRPPRAASSSPEPRHGKIPGPPCSRSMMLALLPQRSPTWRPSGSS